MKTFKIFFESSKTNKFNIHWQIVRTKARNIKNVDEKIDYVLNFLKQNPNKHNFKRVLNWIKMTGLGYPEATEQREAFVKAEQKIHSYYDIEPNIYQSDDDINNDLTKISTEDLQLVLNDLKNRKYNFQFKQIPKDHIEFVKNIENELANR